MAQLDRFLAALTEYKAEALILEQDSPPSFRFLSGSKPVSKQVLDLERVTALVSELAGGDAMSAFEEEGTASFEYALGSIRYTGIVEEDSGKLVATLWETSKELAAAHVGEEHPSTSVGAMSVERPEHPVETTEDADPASTSPADSTVAAVEDVAAAYDQVTEDAERTPSASSEEAPMPTVTQSASASPTENAALSDFGASRANEAIPDDLPAHYREAMDELFQTMVERGASDLHLSSGSPPIVRVDGSVQLLEGRAAFEPEELIRTMFSITPRRNRNEFMATHDTDFAYAIEGLSRFRVNFFYDRKGPGAVMRAIPNEIVSAERLGLPPLVKELARLHRGLVLVTGPTGCGKSTTLAAILDIVNSTREEHVITIEDPIEFVHKNKKCLVNQREVGVHTDSFKHALRAALREDPDVVLVGEMRDLETVEMAIETAETGHLVFGTLHTTTAPSTVDRIIDQFPADRQDQIRTMLSDSLKAVISQTLCKRLGGGRIAAQEILLGNPSVANLIREGKTFQLENAMQTGKKFGMQTLNDHLLQLVQSKKVDPGEAYLKSMDKTNLKEALSRQGIEFEI